MCLGDDVDDCEAEADTCVVATSVFLANDTNVIAGALTT